MTNIDIALQKLVELDEPFTGAVIGPTGRTNIVLKFEPLGVMYVEGLAIGSYSVVRLGEGPSDIALLQGEEADLISDGANSGDLLWLNILRLLDPRVYYGTVKEVASGSTTNDRIAARARCYIHNLPIRLPDAYIVWLAERGAVQRDITFILSKDVSLLELEQRNIPPFDAELIRVVLDVVQIQTINGTDGQFHNERRRLNEQQDVLVRALTRRELQMLSLLARGLVDKQIAGALGLASSTTNKYMRRMLDRIDASNRAEGAIIGARNMTYIESIVGPPERYIGRMGRFLS